MQFVRESDTVPRMWSVVSIVGGLTLALVAAPVGWILGAQIGDQRGYIGWALGLLSLILGVFTAIAVST